MRLSISKINIKPSQFVNYLQVDSTGKSRQTSFFDRVPPSDTKHHGLISKKANKRVSTAIDWLIYLAKDKPLKKKSDGRDFMFKVNFITLTLSSKQVHSDNCIKSELLNQFLTELRTKWKCRHYLWRAEAQQNGNIHFHIASDVFIPWRDLRTSWNRIQNKLGYVDRFREKTGLSDPNSTDIHSVNKVRNLASYLAKYCGKNSKGFTMLTTLAGSVHAKPKYWLTYKPVKWKRQMAVFRQIHGKLWGLSQDLGRYKAASCEVRGRVEEEMNWLEKRFPKQVKHVSMASIYLFTIPELIKVGCTAIASKLNNYVSQLVNPPPSEAFCV